MKDGVLVVNQEGRVVDFNSAARNMLKQKDAILIGSNIGEVLSVWDDFIDKDPHYPYTLQLEMDQGQVCYFDMDVSQLRAWGEHQMGFLVVLREITERRTIEQHLRTTNQILSEKLREIEILKNELREQAIRDPLTNLCNRRYLKEIMNRELPRAMRENYSIGLVMIDIDHFKQFNDTYGHRAGDLMLKTLANFLIRVTRDGDIVCRYGGEEFLILMVNIDQEIVWARAEEFRKRFEIIEVHEKSKVLQATISLGISMYPKHAQTAEGLIELADQALYQAKQAGRNCTVLWRE
jgi:diguanylate cyclase (GGDEF)-like protein/PAS domain S-box-containing protein